MFVEIDGGKTVKSKARLLQPHLKENLKEQIKTWEGKGIIERAPESCSFSSPLVPVLKKNGQVRWAMDYRALNDITVKDYRPIPNVMDKLANIKANTNKTLRYFVWICRTHSITFHYQKTVKTKQQ